MKNSLCFLSTLLISCLLCFGKVYAQTVDTLHIWPLEGTTRISSPFGPRLQASLGYRYDYHRGIDLQTPIGTPVYAVQDGEIRLAGTYPYYEDMLVQIRHYKTSTHSCDNGNCYYTNYMHLSATAVSENDIVNQGDLIGYSGESSSGFDHLHFEIRDKGIYQRNCINPFGMLPYSDTNNLQLDITSVDLTDKYNPDVTVEITSPSRELDFNRVEVKITDILSYIRPIVLASNNFDANNWNYLYTDDFDLDNPDFNGILISPSEFNSSSEIYKIQFKFYDLPIKSNYYRLFITVKATDVKGNYVLATYPRNFPTK